MFKALGKMLVKIAAEEMFKAKGLDTSLITKEAIDELWSLVENGADDKVAEEYWEKIVEKAKG